MSGSIFIESASYSVLEQAGAVSVTFKRTGDASQPVNITYGLNPITAQTGVDFTGESGVAQLAAGETTLRIDIPILDDDLAEPTEVFNLSIISVDSGTLLFPRTTNVSILDNENPAVDPVDPPLESDYDVEIVDVVSGLTRPIGIEWIPGSDSQAIVVEQTGRLVIVDTQSGERQSTLLDISDEVNANADRGLMDIALHPDFDSNPFLYAFYVVDPEGAVDGTGGQRADSQGNRFAHVVKYELDTDGAVPTIVAGSKEILLGAAGQTFADISGEGQLNFTDPQFADNLSSERDSATGEFKDDYIKLDSQSHAGGALAFGPDGNLYVSIGDGTSFNYADPRSADVQNPNSLSGKILRVDPLTGQGLADNPFAEPGADLNANSSKVYQLGLRNPYTMTFTDDGDLFLSETGWFSYEEINSGPAGANFGWPFYEGGDNGELVRAPGYADSEEAQAFYEAVESGQIVVTPPYRAFSHDAPDPGFQFNAIVGSSSVYNGDKYPAEFLNDYFFTDIPQGQIFAIDTNDRTDLKYITNMNPFGPTNFVQGPDGYIYLMDVNGGVKRLEITDPNGSTNEAPVLDLPLDEQSANVGGAFAFQVPTQTFADPDGDTLVLSAQAEDGSPLPSWLTFNAATGEFSGTPSASDVGSLTIRVSASDPSGETTSDVFSLNVGGVNVRPVVADALASQTATVGAELAFAIPQGSFIDANGDPLTFTATLADGSPLPSWLNFDPATGLFSGFPGEANVGRLVITVVASDPLGASTSDSFLLQVEPDDAGNTAPVVALPLSDVIVDEEDAVDFTVPAGTFTDVDGDTLTLSATRNDGSPLPSWLSFDPETGRFTGTPDDADVGPLVVAVAANDGNGGTARDVFNLTVSPVNDAPTLEAPLADQAARVGTAFSFFVSATTFADADDVLLTLSATGPEGAALPDWLTFDPQTGTFTGTPADGDEGIVNVVVTARDAGGLEVSDQFTLRVAEANPDNIAPVVAIEVPDFVIAEEEPIDYTIPEGTFTDADGDELTLSATLEDGSPLPSWLPFDPETGRFTGTPDDADVGEISIAVTADDGNGGTVREVSTVTVTPVNDAPTLVAPLANQSSAIGSAISFAVPGSTFDDVDDATLLLSASGPEGAALPDWLTFDATTGTFSGTPGAEDAGSFEIEVSAQDAAGLSVTDQFTLTIAPTLNENVVNDIAAENQFVTGTTDNDVFAFAGPSSLYNFGETSDGLGVVVWTVSETDTSFDVLFGFETIRFADRDIALDEAFGSGPDVFDDPSLTQYVQGDSDGDRFIIDGQSADYRFNQTASPGGVVVWTSDPDDNSFDILYDFEQLVFNDVAFDISAVNTGGEAVIIPRIGEVDVAAAQTSQPVTGSETFVISADVLGSVADALIEDFSVADGDRLDLDAVLDANFGEATKDDYVRAQSENGNTVVQVDSDGAANGEAFKDVATLEGVSAGPITVMDDTTSVEIAFQNS